MSKLSYYIDMARKVRPLKAAPKVLNYLKYRAGQRQPITSVSRYSPQIAGLLLTKRCNMKCSFCNVATFMHDKTTAWRALEGDLEKVKRIFATPLFANALLVDILGGEPLMVKELPSIIAFLSQRGHLTNITTNGLLLADQVQTLKDAGVSRINISVYEDNRDVLERDLPKINRVFPVNTNMLIFRKDVVNAPDKLLETIRFIKESGCIDLRFWIYRPIGEHVEPDEILYDDEPALLAFREMVEKAVPGFCFWPVPPVKGERAKKLCPQLWQRISCDMQGNLGVCCGTDSFLPAPGGNLFEGDKDAVYNHPVLVKMREQLLDPDAEPPEMCKSCNLLGDPGW